MKMYLIQLRKSAACVALIAFILNQLSASLSFAQGLNLPVPGTMVMPTEGYVPALIRGITIHPENPLQYDFIVDTGYSGLEGEPLAEETSKLIKYFLASLTVPEDEMWVNLSPYEDDRIATDAFGKTEMGRDLLSQDYILKQLTSSLLYPESDLGKEFWQRVYAKAKQKFGTMNIPVNTFNKVWIIPDQAQVYESQNSAFVIKSRLKVMLEEDYIALKEDPKLKALIEKSPAGQEEQVNALGSQVVRDIIIPEIEKEVNEGENFANLRQIYNSMILAAWFKNTLKQSLLGQIYVDQNKVAGVEGDDPEVKQKIYQQYLEAYTRGVYNYIREDVDPVTKDLIPRKYFSGGFQPQGLGKAVATSVVRGPAPDVKPTGRVFSVSTAVTESPTAETTDNSSKAMRFLRDIAATAMLLVSLNGAAVSPEAAKFFADNNILFGYPLTTVQQAGATYDKSLNPIITTNNGRIVLLQGIAPGPNGSKQQVFQIGGNLRDKIPGFPAAPKTFDEVAKVISAAITPKYAKFNAGQMSQAEIQDLAALETDLVTWLNGLLAVESGAIYDPTTQRNDPRANAQYRFVVYNESVNGKPNTYVCETFSHALIVLGANIGLRPEALTLIDSIKDHKGTTFPDKNGVGHVNVLFSPVNGAKNILDQGYTNADFKTWLFMAWDRDGRKKEFNLASVTPQTKFTGLTFRQILADQETKIKLNDFTRKHQDFVARATKPNKESMFEEARRLFDEGQALLQSGLGQREGSEANTFRSNVMSIMFGTLGEGVNAVILRSNAAISTAGVSPEEKRRNFENYLAETERIKSILAQFKMPAPEQYTLPWAPDVASRLSRKRSDLMGFINDFQGTIKRNISQTSNAAQAQQGVPEGKTVINVSQAAGVELTRFIDMLNTATQQANSGRVAEAKAALASLSRQIAAAPNRNEYSALLNEQINQQSDFIAYKELEIRASKYSLFRASDIAIIRDLTDIAKTAGSLGLESNSSVHPKIRPMYRSLADNINRTLAAVPKSASSGVNTIVSVEVSETELSKENIVVAGSAETAPDQDRVGGIDLNPTLLNLQIKRDSNGVPLPLLQQPIGDMDIPGFYPVIINITPVNNLPMLLSSNN